MTMITSMLQLSSGAVDQQCCDEDGNSSCVHLGEVARNLEGQRLVKDWPLSGAVATSKFEEMLQYTRDSNLPRSIGHKS